MIRTIIFSIALIIAAAVLGYQVKQVGGGRETISVKGLAEKPIKADRAEWTVQPAGQGRHDRRGARQAAQGTAGAGPVPGHGGFREGGADRVERIGRA